MRRCFRGALTPLEPATGILGSRWPRHPRLAFLPLAFLPLAFPRLLSRPRVPCP